MGDTLAIMLTMTTYGTWLRGDQRGWVDEGVILPSDPVLENRDRKRMKHSVYLFPKDELVKIGTYIGESLISRKEQRVLALTVQTWHVHVVVDGVKYSVPDLVKC